MIGYYSHLFPIIATPTVLWRSLIIWKRPCRPRVDGPGAFATVFAACNACFPNVGRMSEYTVLELHLLDVF